MYKLLILLMLFTTQIKAEESLKLLIGFPPGGGQHIVGQILEEGLNEMGYKALLINKPGAGGVIAMNECVIKSDPRLLCLVSQSQLVHSGILSPDAVKYDPVNLTYIKLLGESPMVLLSNINNTKTLPEILMDIKNNKVTFGSGALGNTQAAQSLMKHVNSKEGIDVYLNCKLLCKKFHIYLDGNETCGQSYKAPMIVIYDSRVVTDLKLPHIMTLES